MPQKKLRQKTDYEKQIDKNCRKKNATFRFVSGRKFIGGFSPDFLGSSKKLLEVYNPDRTNDEVAARIRMFHRHGYKVQFLPKYIFTAPYGESYIIGMILGFDK